MRSSSVPRRLAATLFSALLVAGFVASCANGAAPPAGLNCSLAEAECNGACANLQTDSENCGKCGTLCTPGLVCVKGVCGADCPSGDSVCSIADSGRAGKCVNTKTDNTNCGVCGKVCKFGEICYGGACSGTCGTAQQGQTVCTPDGGNPICANLKTDNLNCGVCNKACASDLVCVNGVCQGSCTPDQTKCGGDGGPVYCANLKTDNANCGVCGKACGVLESCGDGACNALCSEMQKVCPSGDGGAPSCIDYLSDNRNCGTCGTVCPGNKPLCTAGTCNDGSSTHGTLQLAYDYSGGVGGCGDFSIWYTQNFGLKTYDQCEVLANQYGAQYVGAPTIYAYAAPYAGFVRWIGEATVANGYVSTGIWNSATSVAKSTSQYCILGYANAPTHGVTQFATSLVSTNGKSYKVQDYGVIGEKVCYSNAQAAGARPLNPQMFGQALGVTHMVENHSCHGSLEYSGVSYTSDGGAPHTYRCFLGYNP